MDVKGLSELATSTEDGKPMSWLFPRVLLLLNLTWTVTLIYLSWSGLNVMPQYLSSTACDCAPQQDTKFENIGYSPVADQITINNVLKTTNGRLRDNTSIYRQPPSAAVDKAWIDLSLEDEHIINVTASDLQRAGHDPSGLISWDDHGDVYPAEMEFTHLIHCVDTVRREMWHEHYFASQTLENVKLRKAHAMHCLHVVLQDIVCHAELDLIPLVWMPYSLGDQGKRYAPTSNFNTTKVCRDVEPIRQWLRENYVHDATSMLAKLKPAPGAKVYDDDGYWVD